MNFANEKETPKLRYIIRDGEKVLQERLRIKEHFNWFEAWQDVPTEMETNGKLKLDTFTYD